MASKDHLQLVFLPWLCHVLMAQTIMHLFTLLHPVCDSGAHDRVPWTNNTDPDMSHDACSKDKVI